MYVEFKIVMNTEDGNGSMDMNLERGADPSKIDFEKVKQQLNELFDRMTPVIKNVNLDDVPESFIN